MTSPTLSLSPFAIKYFCGINMIKDMVAKYATKRLIKNFLSCFILPLNMSKNIYVKIKAAANMTRALCPKYSINFKLSSL